MDGREQESDGLDIRNAMGGTTNKTIDNGYRKGDIEPTFMLAGPTVSLRRCLLSFSKMTHSESKRQIQMT